MVTPELRRYVPDEVFDEVVVVTDVLDEPFGLVEEYRQAVDDGDHDAADQLQARIGEWADAAAIARRAGLV